VPNREVARSLGTVLGRAPLLSAAVTTAAMLMLWSGALTLDRSTSRPWLDWVALAWCAYGVLAVFVLVPQVVVPRARVRRSEEEVALLQWSFPPVAFLGAFAAYASGAHAWALHCGLIVTVGLLFLTARSLRISADGR
jgi:hypothetical protein